MNKKMTKDHCPGTVSGKAICDWLEREGFDFLSGVPCSVFTPLFQEIETRVNSRT